MSAGERLGRVGPKPLGLDRMERFNWQHAGLERVTERVVCGVAELEGVPEVGAGRGMIGESRVQRDNVNLPLLYGALQSASPLFETVLSAIR